MSKVYRAFLIIAAMLTVGPVVLGIAAQVPRYLFPDDCDIAARCSHGIVDFANVLMFGLILFGPFVMLLGFLLLLALGLAYGLGLAQARTGTDSASKRRKCVVGTVCVSILLFLIYVPAGPDECSRSYSDTQYEACIQAVVADMNVAETFSWLENNGYRPSPPLTSLSDYARKFNQTSIHFQGIRSYGHYRSVPYGTNFHRLFARIGPAPEHFELDLEADLRADRVVAVDVWWAFSFL
jgi:hypothetical protein